MKSRRNRIALDSLNEWGSGGGREHIRCTNDEEWHESSLIINSVDKTGTKGNGTIWSGFFVIYFGFVFFSVCVWNSHWNGCSRKKCCVCVSWFRVNSNEKRVCSLHNSKHLISMNNWINFGAGFFPIQSLFQFAQMCEIANNSCRCLAILSQPVNIVWTSRCRERENLCDNSNLNYTFNVYATKLSPIT